MDSKIWTEKYRPKLLSEYYISKQELEIVKDWITNFGKNNDDNDDEEVN